MQIDQLRPGQGVPARATSDAGSASRLIDAVTPHTPPASGATSTLRDILAHYDMREISPREFSQMIQKLHDAGELSDADLKELSLIRHEADLSGLDPDEPIDLIALLEKKLKQQQEELERLEKKSGNRLPAADRQAYLAPIERQLDWLERFAMIHKSGSAEALNALI